MSRLPAMVVIEGSRLMRNLIRLVFWSCVWSGVVMGIARAAGGEVIEFSQARFLASDALTPPGLDEPGWITRGLPDNWTRSQPGRGGHGWYRFAFTLPAVPDELWAVYLPRLRMNAAVFVNGEPIGDGGRLDEPVARNWNRPLYFTIPPRALVAGANRIDIHLLGDPNLHAGLYALRAGPDAVLRPIYERRHFYKITLNEALFVTTLLMAALMGTLWLRRREETVYGWFALASLLWAANSTHFFARDLPLTTWQWEWFAQTGTDWFAVLLAVLVHRYFGLRRPRVERAMLVFGVASSAILALSGMERMFAVANVLHTGAVVIGAYIAWVVIGQVWKQRTSDTAIVATAILVQLALGAHDWLLQIGLWGQENWYLMHYAAPVLFAAMAWMLTSRFIQALNDSQALNAELEQRVEQKRRALETSYAEMAGLQRAQVVAEERERIMRDLHDGLGGQLITALAIAQQGKSDMVAVQQTLRDALDDLRLVIDSIDPEEGDLLVLLGTVRARMEPRLAQQGMRFIWQVRDLPSIPGFTPEKALQVLRIVQEAIANVLKHAHARTVTVCTGIESVDTSPTPCVFIEVTDDGVGLRADSGSGRGMHNMRSRAARIGARLDVESRARGTAIKLRLPLPAAA